MIDSVSFYDFFPGEYYWIIDLDEDYKWAVVGHPKRKYLWVLSRTPFMDKKVYEGILHRLKNVHHYDVNKLKISLQPTVGHSK